MTDQDKAFEAAKQKRSQLEREIHQSAASDNEKRDMQHTLSKLWMFASEAVDEWEARAKRYGCNGNASDPDCGSVPL